MSIEHRRSVVDVLLGAVLVLGGLFLLCYAAWATKLSVLFVGWMLLAFGVVGIAGAFRRIGRSGFWSAAVGGSLLLVIGLVFVRNPGLGAVTLTLTAGALFLGGGLARLVAAGQQGTDRLPLVVGGVVSTALGLLVVLNLFTASWVLLGVLLAVETMSEGLVMMLFGRQHATVQPAPPQGASPSTAV